MTDRPSLFVVQGGRQGPLRAADHGMLPAAPRKGFKLEVRAPGDHFAFFTAWAVHEANGRSFVVYCEGLRQRLPNHEWRGWLEARLAEGEITVAAWGEEVTRRPRPRLVEEG